MKTFVEFVKCGDQLVCEDAIPDWQRHKDWCKKYNFSPAITASAAKHRSGFSQAHKNAILLYKGAEPLTMKPFTENRYLRGTTGPIKPNERIRAMDHVTSEQIPENLHVYRGMSIKDGLHNSRAGDVWSDRGYTGATIRPGHALNFADKHPENHLPMVAHIHIPAGSRGHALDVDHNDSVEDLKHEREFLLHRGTRFKVLGHEQGNIDGTPVHLTHLQVHHQDQ